MIGVHSPSEKRCWQTKHHHGNSQGEGEGCVSGVLAVRWTLAGGIAREPAIRSEVLCHWLCLPSLCFPSLPVSRMALLSPSCE